ncbi:MAG: hypothetical protein KF866_03745 [Phycisphaeraceae bacterium]|nr:hypothetical protein [Phycisphaeraceae bacterium]MCW5753193.1 hypothetical protein [Phycisphaeraceae bacterium]
MPRLIVLKFGGSVLLDEDRLRIAVHEIYRWKREGWQVVAVVSALVGRTDQLLEQARRWHDSPDPFSVAALVAGGELESAALLGLHLDRAGIPAHVLTPAAVGLIARGHPLDATPIDLDVLRVQTALDRSGIVVVPGYIAIGTDGRTVVLGRGGSDLSALFLANRLGAACCRLIKDVDGLYEADPVRHSPPPRRYAQATFADALETDGSIVQHKAVRYAQDVAISFELGRTNATVPTHIGSPRTRLTTQIDRPMPLRVGILGLGVVGRGVLDLLCQLPESFTIRSIAVRDPSRHSLPPRLRRLLTTDPVHLAASELDVVIECLGGLTPAKSCLEAALECGTAVVTANKSVVAAFGKELESIACRTGASIRCSAAVGGAVPVLEAITAISVRSLRGVLNGTTNYVLNRISEGHTFAHAVRLAQAHGLAETDPTADLSGRDAAEKLRIIARTLGLPESMPITAQALEAHAFPSCPPDHRLRQVATLDVERATARIAIEALAPGDPLYDLPGAYNAVVLSTGNGTTRILRGAGAGRWPTAEAVLADALSLARSALPLRARELPQETPAHA